ncbi:MAG: hypothetical protein AAFU64_12155, partial [Bacteroidota bacterium]
LREINGDLMLEGNPTLSSLEGLENLREINGSLVLDNNASLRDISSLENLTLLRTGSSPIRTFVNVLNNPQLNDCCILPTFANIFGRKDNPAIRFLIQNNGEDCNALLDIQAQCAQPKFRRFLLRDYTTQEILREVADGDVIDLASVQDRILLFEAEFDTLVVGEVRLKVRGGITSGFNDNTAPYQLTVSRNRLTAGQYSLSVEFLEENTISFSVSQSSAEISDLVLLDTKRQKFLQSLQEGDTINYTRLENRELTIEARTIPASVGSVNFKLRGPLEIDQLENIPPYGLFGNSPSDFDEFLGQELPVGEYTLEVTAYRQVNAQDPGDTLKIHFTVLDTVFECRQPIELISQEEVQAFTCDSLFSDLLIKVNQIQDLSPLRNLKFVQGDLRITGLGGSSTLESLRGLENLQYIGGEFRLDFCHEIRNLDGLAGLTFVGKDFYINDNDKLRDIRGLSQLREVGGSLLIFRNSGLVNLNGLEKLESIGDNAFFSNLLSVVNNPNLNSCCEILALS